MKKYLFLPLISLAFACGNSNEQVETEKVETEELKAPAFALTNLDKSVEPCENFYQFAVGGWLKENPVPSTESRWSSFNVVVESNNEKLRAILDEFAAKDPAKGSMEQKIGDFYKSMMDSTLAEDLGLTPLNSVMDMINSIQTSDELINLSANLRTKGISSLFGLYIGQDDKQSDKYITHIYQGGIGLPDQAYYVKDDEKSLEIQEAYKLHLEKMLKLSGLDSDASKAAAMKIYSIEESLAKISMTRVERRDPDKTYNKMTVVKLSEMSPSINWSGYISAVGLNNVEDLIVSQPNFMKGLGSLIKEIDIEDWKLYMKWCALNSYASSLSSDFVNQNFDFYSKTLSGTKEMKPRWKRSLSKVNGSLGELLGKAFVKRHFPEESKEDVRRMVENLRSVFRERINGLTWMSEETKEKALLKLESFNMKIGYPSKWTDYSSLEITANNPVQNLMNAREFSFIEMINKLGKPVDKEEWFMTPQTVNAYYSSSQNEIVFPAGILQPPFYDANADAAINYGGIGAVIGHEFTHGFDDQGSKYDHEGNLSNWWTEDDRTQFDDRADFVVKQFDSFEPLEGLFVNGKLTLGENIADLGGATLSYHAMEKELEENGEPEPIDGFTYKQRFFLGWAQVWHMNMTDEELRKRIATDSHSPGNYRVIGPLANMPEFADAFGCQSGDPMVNPDSLKAVIW